jgi:hypothetical protein
MLILVENWKNTPDITGRKSSFPAKIVLLIAVAKHQQEQVLQGSSKLTDFGNSSPGAYAKAYFQN